MIFLFQTGLKNNISQDFVPCLKRLEWTDGKLKTYFLSETENNFSFFGGK